MFPVGLEQEISEANLPAFACLGCVVTAATANIASGKHAEGGSNMAKLKAVLESRLRRCNGTTAFEEAAAPGTPTSSPGNSHKASGDPDGSVTLRRLTGERYKIDFSQNEPSDVFRVRVATAAGVEPALLRLVQANGKEVVLPHSRTTDLKDGDVISLIVCLFSSDSLSCLAFSLSRSIWQKNFQSSMSLQNWVWHANLWRNMTEGGGQTR